MAITIAGYTIACDQVGCTTTITLKTPQRYVAQRQADLQHGWATDLPRFVETTTPGRQDFCPQHRQEVHHARLRAMGIDPTTEGAPHG